MGTLFYSDCVLFANMDQVFSLKSKILKKYWKLEENPGKGEEFCQSGSGNHDRKGRVLVTDDIMVWLTNPFHIYRVAVHEHT